jgi:thioredoxin reductase (NADPH)
MILARDVVGLDVRGPVRAVELAGGTEIEARAVIVATGVSYRALDAPGLADYTGRGVFYGATASEANLCAGDDVYLVGAANSAGQAALSFARHARRVVVLVRSDTLEHSMSRYLLERIRAAENIEVLLRTEVVAAHGDGHLEAITLADRASGTETEVKTNWLFAFIGASPHTDWLGDAVARDEKGFLITGHEHLTRDTTPPWPLGRPPFLLETSVPGVFAAGDVRLDSMKRVASAVGEGAMSVYLVHKYLATI